MSEDKSIGHHDVSLIKQRLYDHCRAYVEHLINTAQAGIKESQVAASQEGKSSAGDKFETHRAMMHLQMEGFIRRLESAESLERKLNAIKPKKQFCRVESGSLIETDRGWYYVSLSANPLVIEGVKYICLSTEAPIYRSLAGGQGGEGMEWIAPDGEEEWIEILAVY